MLEWKEIALAYRKELEALWEEIDASCDELCKGMPRSFDVGLNRLDKSLDISKKHVTMLLYQEEAEEAQDSLLGTKSFIEEKKEPKRKAYEEDCFKWLYSD